MRKKEQDVTTVTGKGTATVIVIVTSAMATPDTGERVHQSQMRTKRIEKRRKQTVSDNIAKPAWQISHHGETESENGMTGIDTKDVRAGMEVITNASGRREKQNENGYMRVAEQIRAKRV